jgi:Xaa-Pro aminopeptidase
MDQKNKEGRIVPDFRSYADRVNRIRSQFLKHHHYALLILTLKHIRYLVGFSGSDGALLISNHDVFLFVDGRYTTQAAQESQAEVIEYKEKIVAVANTIIKMGFQEIGFDSAEISFEQYTSLVSNLQGIHTVPVSKELETIRCIKDNDEVKLIKKAAEIAASAYESMLESVRPGIEERELALELEYKIRTKGAEAVSFDTIMASGPNSAMPHATPGWRKLKNGDFIVVDFGAKYMGYNSDETCTIGLSELDKDQISTYSVVKAAHDMGLERIQAGVSCKEIDQIVRGHIEENGFGPYFRHGTGHGVGLDVHEAPRLALTSDLILQAGMVITVEPGIYIPGKWGIRIEDLILVKEEGFEILSGVNKNLHVLVPGS